MAAARKRTKDEPEEEAEEVAEERHNYPHGRVAMGYLDGPLQQQQLQQQQKQQLSIHSGYQLSVLIKRPISQHSAQFYQFNRIYLLTELIEFQFQNQFPELVR